MATSSPLSPPISKERFSPLLPSPPPMSPSSSSSGDSEQMDYSTFAATPRPPPRMERLVCEEDGGPAPFRKRRGDALRLVLTVLLFTAFVYVSLAFSFLIYQHTSRFSLQVRVPPSPLDSFINPKSSLASAGPEFCRLYRDDDGRIGLYELKCRSGVALDVVWSGNGSCQMLALGGDRWWQHARSWRVECGEEMKWVGGIENRGERWEAWLE
jgi:hypothetical protein